MIAEENRSCWYVLRTAPKMERKLLRNLNAAGYMAFCPMQVVFKKWNGQLKEVFVPLFSGHLFVEASTDIASFVTSQNAAVLLDNTNQKLSICADRAELPVRLTQLFTE